MKVSLFLLVLISQISFASDVFTIGEGVDTPMAPNCFAVAMFEENLSSDQAVKLCANSDPAPVFCFRFAKRMNSIGTEGALEVCAKTPSMMKSIDCLTENSELSSAELIEMCRSI